MVEYQRLAGLPEDERFVVHGTDGRTPHVRVPKDLEFLVIVEFVGHSEVFEHLT